MTIKHLAIAASALTLSGRPTSPLELVPFVERLKSVKGRMSPVREGQDFAVLVDYATHPAPLKSFCPPSGP